METLNVKTWSGREGCTLFLISSNLVKLSPPGITLSWMTARWWQYNMSGMPSTTALLYFWMWSPWSPSSSTRSTSQTLALTLSDSAHPTSVLTKVSLAHFPTENSSNGSAVSPHWFSSLRPSSIWNVSCSALVCRGFLAETSWSTPPVWKITLTRQFSVLQPTQCWFC